MLHWFVNYTLTSLLLFVALSCFAQDTRVVNLGAAAPRTTESNADAPATAAMAKQHNEEQAKRNFEFLKQPTVPITPVAPVKPVKAARLPQVPEPQFAEVPEITPMPQEAEGTRIRRTCAEARSMHANKKRSDLTVHEERVIELCQKVGLWGSI
jgi:hypothetical protein